MDDQLLSTVCIRLLGSVSPLLNGMVRYSGERPLNATPSNKGEQIENPKRFQKT